MNRSDISKLSKQEQRELVETIDALLDFIYVPVAKAADDEVAKIEQALADMLISEWDDATKAAVKKAASAIQVGPGDKPTKQEVQTLIEVLANELGPGFVQNLPAKQTELVGAAYITGKQGVGKEVGVAMSLNLEDEKAQGILKKHHTFWIGEHYHSELGDNITSIVNQVALDSGLGRVEVGRQLQKTLGPIFSDKSDNYWRLLGAATVHRARNLGGVSGLIDAGVSEYEIMAVLDERTSAICRFMDGKVFQVGDAKKHRDAVINAQSPEDIIKLAPWHSASEDPATGEVSIRAGGSKPWKIPAGNWTPAGNMSSKQLAGRGLALPPYHGFCRTSYIVKNFTNSYVDSPDPLPLTYQEAKDDGLKIPPVSALQYEKDGGNLGGAGKKEIYTDGKGGQYLFKPAVSKAGQQPESFRAYAQEFASEIQSRVYDGADFIPVKATKIGQQFGTLQPLIDNMGDLAGMQNSLHKLPQAHLEQIQAEHVIDWLISNHDSHGGQFIISKAGKIHGIDKEQAFRYFPNDKLAWDYHPNSQYGENEPIYNTMMKDWMAGKIDLNPNHILPYIKRVEAISEETYVNMLMHYAESRFQDNEAAVDTFLQAALTRKENIRKDFEGLYSQVMTAKLGKKYTFTFGDTMPAKDFLQAPMAVQAFSVGDLNKMTSKSIKELGKAQAVPYFQQMTKDELVQALAYPEQAESISALVKERTRAKAALARAEGPTKPEPKKPAAAPATKDPFEDLDVLGNKAFGYALQKDSILVEGQHVNIRKVFDGTKDEYQISFKLLPDVIDKVDAAMKSKLGAKVDQTIDLAGGSYDKSGKFLANPKEQVNIKSRTLRATLPDGTKIMFMNDYKAKAYRGRMTITVDGYDGKKGATKLADVLKQLDLEAIKNNPTDDDEKLLKLSRLLAQHRPALLGKIQPSDRTVAGITTQLKKEGLDPVQVDKWTKKEVWPGYFTYLDAKGADDMIKAGADHVFAGVGHLDGALAIIKGGGLSSTTERYRNGLFVKGASSSADIGTGGAESVFTRLVTTKNKGEEYDNSLKGGPYVFKINPRVLERTDWYAFSHDNYGNSEEYDERESRKEIVNTLMRRWKSGNEVMFRHGIQLDQVDEIRCQTNQHRQQLINRLKADGVKDINGIALDKFIVTGARM